MEPQPLHPGGLTVTPEIVEVLKRVNIAEFANICSGIAKLESMAQRLECLIAVGIKVLRECSVKKNECVGFQTLFDFMDVFWEKYFKGIIRCDLNLVEILQDSLKDLVKGNVLKYCYDNRGQPKYWIPNRSTKSFRHIRFDSDVTTIEPSELKPIVFKVLRELTIHLIFKTEVELKGGDDFPIEISHGYTLEEILQYLCCSHVMQLNDPSVCKNQVVDILRVSVKKFFEMQAVKNEIVMHVEIEKNCLLRYRSVRDEVYLFEKFPSLRAKFNGGSQSALLSEGQTKQQVGQVQNIQSVQQIQRPVQIQQQPVQQTQHQPGQQFQQSGNIQYRHSSQQIQQKQVQQIQCQQGQVQHQHSNQQTQIQQPRQQQHQHSMQQIQRQQPGQQIQQHQPGQQIQQPGNIQHQHSSQHSRHQIQQQQVQQPGQVLQQHSSPQTQYQQPKNQQQYQHSSQQLQPSQQVQRLQYNNSQQIQQSVHVHQIQQQFTQPSLQSLQRMTNIFPQFVAERQQFQQPQPQYGKQQDDHNLRLRQQQRDAEMYQQKRYEQHLLNLQQHGLTLTQHQQNYGQIPFQQQQLLPQQNQGYFQQYNPLYQQQQQQYNQYQPQLHPQQFHQRELQFQKQWYGQCEQQQTAIPPQVQQQRPIMPQVQNELPIPPQVQQQRPIPPKVQKQQLPFPPQVQKQQNPVVPQIQKQLPISPPEVTQFKVQEIESPPPPKKSKPSIPPKQQTEAPPPKQQIPTTQLNNKSCCNSQESDSACKSSCKDPYSYVQEIFTPPPPVPIKQQCESPPPKQHEEISKSLQSNPDPYCHLRDIFEGLANILVPRDKVFLYVENPSKIQTSGPTDIGPAEVHVVLKNSSTSSRTSSTKIEMGADKSKPEGPPEELTQTPPQPPTIEEEQAIPPTPPITLDDTIEKIQNTSKRIAPFGMALKGSASKRKRSDYDNGSSSSSPVDKGESGPSKSVEFEVIDLISSDEESVDEEQMQIGLLTSLSQPKKPEAELKDPPSESVKHEVVDEANAEVEPDMFLSSPSEPQSTELTPEDTAESTIPEESVTPQSSEEPNEKVPITPPEESVLPQPQLSEEALSNEYLADEQSHDHEESEDDDELSSRQQVLEHSGESESELTEESDSSEEMEEAVRQPKPAPVPIMFPAVVLEDISKRRPSQRVAEDVSTSEDEEIPSTDEVDDELSELTSSPSPEDGDSDNTLSLSPPPQELAENTSMETEGVVAEVTVAEATNEVNVIGGYSVGGQVTAQQLACLKPHLDKFTNVEGSLKRFPQRKYGSVRIPERFVYVEDDEDKLWHIFDVEEELQSQQSYIICEKEETARELAATLKSRGINICHNWDEDQVKKFFDGEVRSLILTDDSPLNECYFGFVPVIFNYDFPKSLSSYLTRRELIGYPHRTPLTKDKEGCLIYLNSCLFANLVHSSEDAQVLKEILEYTDLEEFVDEEVTRSLQDARSKRS